VDWLGLSLRAKSDPLPVDGHVWREYSATNIWGKRRVLWSNEGDRVCTLLSEPRSSIIGSNQALLEIDNEWLYHGTGTRGVLDKLATSMFYDVTGISRLDLAVDFVPDKRQAEIIRGLASGKYYVQGKQNGSGFWSTDGNEKLSSMWTGDRIPHCLSWGHKTSSIRWKLYYKSKELLDACGGAFFDKPYIVDIWKQYGFDVSNVWRLEVSMHHLNTLNLYGEVIDLDTVEQQRPDIFLSLYNSRFVVRENQGHADKTNDKIVPFLNLRDDIRHVRMRPAGELAEHSGRVTLLRHLVKSLEDEHILLDKRTRSDVLAHIGRIVERDRMYNYFRMVTGYWYSEYVQVINELAGQASSSGKSPVVNTQPMQGKGEKIKEDLFCPRGAKSIGTYQMRGSYDFDESGLQEKKHEQIMPNTSFEDLSDVMQRVKNEEQKQRDEYEEWKRAVREEVKRDTTVKYYGSKSGNDLLLDPQLP